MVGRPLVGHAWPCVSMMSSGASQCNDEQCPTQQGSPVEPWRRAESDVEGSMGSRI